MFERIDISAIVINHFKTLRSLNQKSRIIYWKDFVLFILIPVIISGLLTFKGIQLDSQVSNVIAFISIFGGFLFNLLAIIYGFLDKLKFTKHNEEDDIKVKLKKKFAVEIHTNIAFNIFLSIVTTAFLLVYSFFSSKESNPIYLYIKKGLLFIDYFLIFFFCLTLLMILNRMYILLQNETVE